MTISDTSLFEVYLHECDISAPLEYRMNTVFYENLNKIIQLSKKDNLPTIRFELEDDYKYLDREYEKEFNKKFLKSWDIPKFHQPLNPTVKFCVDERPLSKYRAVILSGNSPADVGNIYPEKYRSVDSVIDDLKEEGVETAIVVGGYLHDCISDVIRLYLQKKLDILVPYDATHEINERYDIAKRKIEKLGAKVITTEDLVRLF